MSWNILDRVSIYKAFSISLASWRMIHIRQNLPNSVTAHPFCLGHPLIQKDHTSLKVIKICDSGLNVAIPIVRCDLTLEYVCPFPMFCDIWYLIRYSPWLSKPYGKSTVFSCSLTHMIQTLPIWRLITGHGSISPFLRMKIQRFLESSRELSWCGWATEIDAKRIDLAG